MILSIIRFLKRLLWHWRNNSVRRDIDFALNISPFSCHKLLVAWPIRATGRVRGVLDGPIRAVFLCFLLTISLLGFVLVAIFAHSWFWSYFRFLSCFCKVVQRVRRAASRALSWFVALLLRCFHLVTFNLLLVFRVRLRSSFSPWSFLLRLSLDFLGFFRVLIGLSFGSIDHFGCWLLISVSVVSSSLSALGSLLSIDVRSYRLGLFLLFVVLLPIDGDLFAHFASDWFYKRVQVWLCLQTRGSLNNLFPIGDLYGIIRLSCAISRADTRDF